MRGLGLVASGAQDAEINERETVTRLGPKRIVCERLRMAQAEEHLRLRGADGDVHARDGL